GAAEVFWLSDGIFAGRDGDGAEAAAKELADAMSKVGPVHVLSDAEAQLPVTLSAPGGGEPDLTFVVRRASSGGPSAVFVRASAERGQLLARQEVTLPAGQTQATFTVD